MTLSWATSLEVISYRKLHNNQIELNVYTCSKRMEGNKTKLYYPTFLYVRMEKACIWPLLIYIYSLIGASQLKIGSAPHIKEQNIPDSLQSYGLSRLCKLWVPPGHEYNHVALQTNLSLSHKKSVPNFEWILL